MIYLPAATGRTTQHLRHTGIVAAVVGGALIIVIVVAEIYSAGGHGAGAHLSLYAGVGVCAVVSASCLSFAFARELIGQTATAICAELARLGETERQLIAEMARLRAAVLDLAEERPGRTLDLTPLREEVGRAIHRAEARGYVAGVRQRLADRGRPGRPHPMRPE